MACGVHLISGSAGVTNSFSLCLNEQELKMSLLKIKLLKDSGELKLMSTRFKNMCHFTQPRFSLVET